MQSVTVIAAILLFVIISADGQQEKAATCGQRIPDAKALMINAFNASHFPWHAAIYHKEARSVLQYKCGGTVIDSISILTAAHCVSRYNEPMDAAKIVVSLGRLNLAVNESSSQLLNADEIILHSNYSVIDYNNDIAIIRLTKNATFNNYVRPICLWNASKTNLSELIGSAGTVIGWGRTESAEQSDVLRQALMPVVDKVECLITNRAFVGTYLSTTNFCAGSRNGTSICEGDSGGSMTFEVNGLFYIRGIVSVTAMIHNETTQQFVCDPTQFAIFTDVAQYLPWIYNQTSECVNIVRCDYVNYGDRSRCRIFLQINHSERKCKIIFADDTYTNVTTLVFEGEFATLPDAINTFEKLTTLHLSHVQLGIVNRANLASFSRIHFLYLSGNLISELASDVFDDLKDLEILDISRNKLKAIHRDVFQELHNLTEIQLGANQLEHLPDGLFRNNQKLEEIWLSRNKINVLHRDVFKDLHSLDYIDLDNNQLETLPDGLFRDNQKLVQILLYGNKIKVLHRDVLKDLRNLKKLDLDSNQVEVLPDGLFRDNQELVSIRLSGNKIRKIECNFYNLPNLTYLLLGRNVCIDEYCDVKSFCGTTSMNAMHAKIWSKCPTDS